MQTPIVTGTIDCLLLIIISHNIEFIRGKMCTNAMINGICYEWYLFSNLLAVVSVIIVEP